MLGVLRDTTTGLLTDPPQPTCDDVPRLVESARSAGMRVDVVDRLEHADELAAMVGRTVYQVVQAIRTVAGSEAMPSPSVTRT